jgi:ubiquitin C-terminal hydrolase
MEVEEGVKVPQRYGLVNVGNTCYMNAAIQLLRSIPELNQIVRNFKITNVVLGLFRIKIWSKVLSKH